VGARSKRGPQLLGYGEVKLNRLLDEATRLYGQDNEVVRACLKEYLSILQDKRPARYVGSRIMAANILLDRLVGRPREIPEQGGGRPVKINLTVTPVKGVRVKPKPDAD
jgi:hypothetical protein